MKKTLIPGLVVLLLASCSKEPVDTSKQEMPVVYTVNYPLAYFSEYIAGDAVTVIFPEMEGDPAFWEPTPEEITPFQEADLILLNGADYAKWVPRVSLPHSKLIDTSVAYREQLISIDGSASHAHGPGGAHAHGAVAFTTWLDPQLAILQLNAIQDAFSKHWNLDDSRFQALEKNLLLLDEKLAEAFGPFDDQPLLGSHPVYQYLARRYHLNLKSVHWEPDMVPDAAMLRELEDILEAHPAKLMLWEGEPLPEIKALLAEKGIACNVFDPCGNRPDNGDFMQVMWNNNRRLDAPAE